MGFKMPKFKAPKIKLDNKSAGNWIKNVTGQFNFLNKKPEEMQLPGESAEQTALRKRLYGEAQDFRSNLGGMQGDARNNITRGANQAIESGELGVRRGMNQRGMLYSGMREAGEQGVRANVASQMAKQTVASNKELEDLASRKEQVAASVGLDSYRDAVARESEIANMNMANSVARAQAMQQIGQGAGYAAGAYAGRAQPTTATATPTYSGTTMAGQSNLNTSTYGKAGGAMGEGEMLGDKNAPGAARTMAQAAPVEAKVAGPPSPSQFGLFGSASQTPQSAAPAPSGLGSPALRQALMRQMGIPKRMGV